MDNKMFHTDSIIDRYEILTPLDQDADVYLVMDRQTKEVLVEKNISVHNLNLYQQLEAHPLKGVPRIYRIEVANGKTMLIEEYIHGLNLNQVVINQGPLPEDLVVSYMIGLCDILDQFHAMSPPVIHRDIKPGNIILSSKGEIYLIDFNISREYKNGLDVDTVSLVSHHFSAPESYGVGQTDIRSDIYSIGATMHFLLTGGYIKQTSYDGVLKDIIKKTTQMDPEGRYQSLGELTKDLRKFANVPDDQDAAAAGLRKADATGVTAYEENDWKSFLPPGFRSGNWGSILLAAAGYGLVFWMCFTMDIESTLKGPFSLVDLWMERTFVFAFFIMAILLLFNYRNCLDRLPGISRIRSRILRRILGVFILFSLMLGVIVLCVSAMSAI